MHRFVVSFTISFALGGKGALTPLTKILRTFRAWPSNLHIVRGSAASVGIVPLQAPRNRETCDEDVDDNYWRRSTAPLFQLDCETSRTAPLMPKRTIRIPDEWGWSGVRGT